ncbi:MAG: DegT/DnrJ/EryC1/StrS family aminotransferase [[Eubacterium] rectale]|nr:DegT/DnrJ/EryC1/StrS family aminotransferase [Agathobacter rectalis]
MIKVTGSRASSILYNWLVCNRIQGAVIIPANICETVPAAYYKAGLQVFFCDIEPDTFQPQKREIENLIAQFEGKCVLHYNHTYGASLVNDKHFITKIKKDYPNVIIVDDQCLCVPDQWQVKTEADLSLYSTGKTKVVDLNFGGFAFMPDKWTYQPTVINYNPKCFELFEEHIKECHRNNQKVSKEILVSDWIENETKVQENYFEQIRRKLKESLEHKKQINSIYSTLQGSMGMEYQNWRYNILVENQAECLKALFDNNLFASFHYKSLGEGYFEDTKTPICNWLENHVINLFNDFHYSESQASKTVEILKRVSIPVKEDSWRGKSNDIGGRTPSSTCNKES